MRPPHVGCEMLIFMVAVFFFNPIDDVVPEYFVLRTAMYAFVQGVYHF